MTQAMFEQWTEMPAGSLDGWAMHPYQIDGITRAVAAMEGTEIHFAIDPDWRRRLIRRGNTRDFLAPLLEHRGYLTTRAVVGGEHHDFLTRLGFKLTRTDGAVDYYMLAGLPFSAGDISRQC